MVRYLVLSRIFASALGRGEPDDTGVHCGSRPRGRHEHVAGGCVGRDVGADDARAMVLHRLGAHLHAPAAYARRLLASLSWQEVERAAVTHRLVRLRH